jgi:glucans biosynthesis protein
MTPDSPAYRLWQSPRCGAKTRAGTPCQRAANKGKTRCRLHGGGKGSGAPAGKRNGNWKGGAWTKGEIAEKRAVSAVLRDGRAQLRSLKEEG